MVSVESGTSWISKVTFDNLKTEAGTKLAGVVDMVAYLNRTYGVDPHGWEYTEGKTWSYTEDTVLVPPLAPGTSKVYEAEVVLVEDVTVGAGTYSCFKIEYTLVEMDGVAVDPPVVEKTEWWSAEVSGLVKSINHVGYELEEVQELASFTMG